LQELSLAVVSLAANRTQRRHRDLLPVAKRGQALLVGLLLQLPKHQRNQPPKHQLHQLPKHQRNQLLKHQRNQLLKHRQSQQSNQSPPLQSFLYGFSDRRPAALH
jgi:hypothetical protein